MTDGIVFRPPLASKGNGQQWFGSPNAQTSATLMWTDWVFLVTVHSTKTSVEDAETHHRPQTLWLLHRHSGKFSMTLGSLLYPRCYMHLWCRYFWTEECLRFLGCPIKLKRPTYRFPNLHIYNGLRIKSNQFATDFINPGSFFWENIIGKKPALLEVFYY